MQVFPQRKLEPAAEYRISSSTDIKKTHYVCLRPSPPPRIIMYNLIMQLEALWRARLEISKYTGLDLNIVFISHLLFICF